MGINELLGRTTVLILNPYALHTPRFLSIEHRSKRLSKNDKTISGTLFLRAKTVA